MTTGVAAPQETNPVVSGGFLRHVNTVLVTYAIDGALAFAAGVLVARLLGPEGRGAYALFVVSATLAQMVLGVGIANAAVYFVSKGQLAARDVIAATHTLALAAAAITLAVAVVAALISVDRAFGGHRSIWLLPAATAALIEGAALRAVLQSQRRFVASGIATILQPAIMLVAAAALYWADAGVVAVLVAWTISNWAAALLAAVLIFDAASRIPRVEHVRRLATFGVQGEAGNVLQLLNYRLDQYLLRAFVGLSGVGIYAVSVSLTEAVWMLANAVALVLVPRLAAADDEEARRVTPLAARNTIAIGTLAAIVLGIAAPIVVPAVFGHAYEGSVRALWWLLPGTVALTGSKVLTGYIFSRGRPLVNTGITVASLIITLAALLVLVPPFGVEGAAAASSVAYGVHFVAALWAFRRISGASVMETVVPQRADLDLYADAARRALGSLAPGSTSAPAGSIEPRQR
jgi:O-antigen/teichoic acid export membrane protein